MAQEAAQDGGRRGFLAALARVGLVTAVVDFCFASALNVFAYHSSVARVWQGVAATLLGRDALQGGTGTALVGVAMHITVAFSWSAVFLLLASRLPRLRALALSPYGVLKTATLYGPMVWFVMSFAVIPLLLQRPPTVGLRWVVQVFGHIGFVAVPMIAASRAYLRGLARAA